MSYKKIIDTFLTNRYNYLIECSTNILKYNNIVEPTELVGELSLYLYTNKPKIEEYLAIDKLEAFCVSWMTINGKYNTSPVNRKHSQREYELNDTYDVVCNDIEFDNYIGMDEYEKDLSITFNDEQIKKILSMDKVIDILTKSELILFKAYFVENLSYDKICKKYTFYREKDGKKITYKSKKSIYTLMNGLKNKIRENI